MLSLLLFMFAFYAPLLLGIAMLIGAVMSKGKTRKDLLIGAGVCAGIVVAVFLVLNVP